MVCQNCQKKDEEIYKKEQEILKLLSQRTEYAKLLLSQRTEYDKLLTKKNEYITQLQKEEFKLQNEKNKIQNEIKKLKEELKKEEDKKSVASSSFSNDINNINNEINFSQNVDNLLDNLYSNGEKEAIAKINPKDFNALQQKVVETYRQLQAIHEIIVDIYNKHYNEAYGSITKVKTWNVNSLSKIEEMMKELQKMLDSIQKNMNKMDFLALKLIPDRTQQNKYFNQIANDNNQLKGTINNLRNKKVRNQLLKQNSDIDMNFINYI